MKEIVTKARKRFVKRYADLDRILIANIQMLFDQSRRAIACYSLARKRR